MLFSVVIPAYNAEKFILRSVNSVIKQQCQDFELIVVNDGSTDNTLSVLQSINFDRLKIVNQSNQGVSVARNNGILTAQGEFICLLDADDEFCENHLAIMRNLIIKYPKYDFFITRELVRLNNNKIIAKLDSYAEKFYHDPVLPILKKEIIICTGVSAIRKKLFNKYGMFKIGCASGEDVDMWRRLYVHVGLMYCSCGTFIRNRDNSMLTRYYKRNYIADPLNRMPIFMSDKTISNEVKKSLKIAYECEKLSVVRSYLYDGNKVQAYCMLKDIDFIRIPFIRIVVTIGCFFVPSWLIRQIIKYKSREYYLEK